MLFSLLKHHFDLNITDTALKLSRSLYCFTTAIFHGVENYFPMLWGTGISDAIFIRCNIPKYEVYFMGDNQAINRVQVDSSKTRNRGTLSGSLAACFQLEFFMLISNIHFSVMGLHV